MEDWDWSHSLICIIKGVPSLPRVTLTGEMQDALNQPVGWPPKAKGDFIAAGSVPEMPALLFKGQHQAG